MNKGEQYNSNIDNGVIFENFEIYDVGYGAVTSKASKETVFELFNGVITAIEEETNGRTLLTRLHNGNVPFNEKRNVALVESYDTFINASDFELDVFSVGKFEMENFWNRMEREKDAHAKKGKKNYVRTSNKGVTYGDSTIYQVDNGVVVFGFLLNNMTYDGQNSWFLSSVKAGKASRLLFKGTGAYPKEFSKISGKRTRWGRIISKLAVNGGDTTNAWSILEDKDSMFFYAELKKHNGVDKEMRRQLKAVRRAAGGLTFDLYIEELEEELEELEQELSSNPDNVDAALRYEEIADKLESYAEEHNSDNVVSYLEDYDNFNYFEANGY